MFSVKQKRAISDRVKCLRDGLILVGVTLLVGFLLTVATHNLVVDWLLIYLGLL